MNRGWRLFIALPVPASAIAALDGRLAGLRARTPAVHWVPRQLIHLTLRFLGEQPAACVPDVVAALDAVSAAGEPFDVALSGGGAFGRGSAGGRICWVGLDGQGDRAVARLASAVEVGLAPLALGGPDRRDGPLRVHLTVARRAGPDLPGAVAAALADGPAIGWQVDRLGLYRSHLEVPVARHEPLWTGWLGPGLPGSGGPIEDRPAR
ncbi:MAG: RNA 2',3'-cyclic phosphodiesterase [Chloroflexota bacterium]|nr:MAG: RNA 2',3'-cyclic phosphodiesterase [Chloroflexota bacterium]